MHAGARHGRAQASSLLLRLPNNRTAHCELPILAELLLLEHASIIGTCSYFQHTYFQHGIYLSRAILGRVVYKPASRPLNNTQGTFTLRPSLPAATALKENYLSPLPLLGPSIPLLVPGHARSSSFTYGIYSLFAQARPTLWTSCARPQPIF